MCLHRFSAIPPSSLVEQLYLDTSVTKARSQSPVSVVTNSHHCCSCPVSPPDLWPPHHGLEPEQQDALQPLPGPAGAAITGTTRLHPNTHLKSFSRTFPLKNNNVEMMSWTRGVLLSAQPMTGLSPRPKEWALPSHLVRWPGWSWIRSCRVSPKATRWSSATPSPTGFRV